MEVVFIKKKYTPFGGAEVYLNQVLKEFQNKIQVHLLTTSWTGLSEVKVHKIPVKKFFLSDIMFAFRVRSYLKEHFRGKKYVSFSFERTIFQDIYRASDGCHLSWLENRFKYLDKAGIKQIFINLSPKQWQIKWLEKKCLKVSKIIVVNSKMVLEEYRKFYGEEIAKKCVIVYNGVDLERFFPAEKEEKQRIRKKLRLPLSSPLILFVGSGYKRKGLITLLRAVKLVKEGCLVVIGKDKKLEWFRSLTERMRIERQVMFLGPRKNVEEFYRAVDIFVLPTIYDPFSNTCLEAMASGLPVITTLTNGASELIKEGENGFLLKNPSDFEELAVLITQGLNQAEKMGIQARKIAEGFSMEKAVKKLYDVIEKCIKNF
jgi:UDP-glucose:(heptosyl)LPS alpha-1,3-glucosyltransferase